MRTILDIYVFIQLIIIIKKNNECKTFDVTDWRNVISLKRQYIGTISRGH